MKRGEKLPAFEKVNRDRQIVMARLQHRSWASIAEEFDLDMRSCTRIWDSWKENEAKLREADPLDLVDEMVARYEAAQDFLADLAANAEQEGVRVTAKGKQLDAMKQEIELLQAIGVLPKNLGKLRIEIDQRRVAMVLIEKLAEHGVPQAVQEDIVQVLERG